MGHQRARWTFRALFVCAARGRCRAACPTTRGTPRAESWRDGRQWRMANGPRTRFIFLDYVGSRRHTVRPRQWRRGAADEAFEGSKDKVQVGLTRLGRHWIASRTELVMGSATGKAVVAPETLMRNICSMERRACVDLLLLSPRLLACRSAQSASGPHVPQRYRRKTATF